MTIFLIVIGIIFLIGIILFGYEMKHSILVDSKEPFLRGDYDPKCDPTLKEEK